MTNTNILAIVSIICLLSSVFLVIYYDKIKASKYFNFWVFWILWLIINTTFQNTFGNIHKTLVEPIIQLFLK